MRNELKEKCGVAAAISINLKKSIAKNLYLCAHFLQHRGQESFGFTTFDFLTKQVKNLHKYGNIAHNMKQTDLNKIEGTSGVAHLRYSTFGEKHTVKNIQPFNFTVNNENISIAHNGNITNTKEVISLLSKNNSFPKTSSDSELIGLLLKIAPYERLMSRIAWLYSKIEGAFSVTIATFDRIYGFRDSYGYRPLCFGRSDGIWLISSETCGLDIGLNSSLEIFDVLPGEIVEILNTGKVDRMQIQNKKKNQLQMCAMEYIYFARPDSNIDGVNVHLIREKLGMKLAEEYKVKADFVVGVPDSSLSAALGYSKKSKLLFEYALIKNRYITRSFISPTASERRNRVILKFNINKNVIENKTVVLIDDSLVRGTTSLALIDLFIRHNVKKLHFFIASPEIIAPCYYGIDIKSYQELAMAKQNRKNFFSSLPKNVSVKFLSTDAFENVMVSARQQKTVCMSCFLNVYPNKVKDIQKND